MLFYLEILILFFLNSRFYTIKLLSILKTNLFTPNPPAGGRKLICGTVI
jgi:hypothetical protein